MEDPTKAALIEVEPSSIAPDASPPENDQVNGQPNGGPTVATTRPKRRAPKKKKGPNYAQLHSKALPLDVYPLPAFHPSHPLSLLRLVYVYLSHLITPPSSHPQSCYHGYFSPETRSVHITDPKDVRALWEMGFFGKGSLSRSEPSWMSREQAKVKAERGGRGGGTAEEATRARREERRMFKLERARLEREKIEHQRAIEEGRISQADEIVEGDEVPLVAEEQEGLQVEEASSLNVDPAGAGPQEVSLHSVTNTIRAPGPVEDSEINENDEEELTIADQEHLQLTLEEAFFLIYALGVLTIHDRPRLVAPGPIEPLPLQALPQLFARHATFPPSAPLQPHIAPDNTFLLNYVTYHHFRSLGWVVRSGVKFSVDYLLYNRGPVFSHAEFAVLIQPAYTHAYWSTERGRAERRVQKQGDWWWLHCVNRVQSQVKKSLVIVYVDIPPPLPPSSRDGEKDDGFSKMLKRYKVREFVVRRWLANRSRD